MAAVAAGVALLCACASPGPLPGPGPAPGPIIGASGGSPGFPGAPRSSRFPRYADAIRQISLRAGHLGWGGVEVGMSFHQAELAVGQHLPALGSSAQDELCGYYTLETAVMRQPLRLEFDARSGESRLKAIWLPLSDPREPEGVPATLDIVRALKARFPDLRYAPSPHAPDLAESVNPRPLYALDRGGMIFVDPRRGVYFGEICVD
jgi:hypothetical protein